ncbi:MAG: hypothetical protein HF978_17805 [Desulfobacteraceae bacterium]|nr:hypothetical protein [Desulfobacteraceae bacterium]MBC2757403.1 hypothetical protein [Desulfobacteraceae bacterium]
MTCELFDGACEECHIEYCPDTIEDLNFKYLQLKNERSAAEEELERVEEELMEFEKEHRKILV